MTAPDARTGTAADAPTAVTDWLVRAQDGQAAAVLAEIEGTLGRLDIDPQVRVRARYVQAIALSMVGDRAEAVAVGRHLCDLCQDLGLTAFSVRARALLVHLLQDQGERDEAAEHLAHAAALEPALQDLRDPEVQAALGALAVALRLSDVTDEAQRVEARLAVVERELPIHQRVSRWSNLAFEHAGQALAAARQAPYRVDGTLLDRAVEEIERARTLAGWRSYDVVTVEALVLAAVREAFTGDADVARRRLDDAVAVLERGPEAASAQLFWAAAVVRSLVRLGRATEGARVGRRYLRTIAGGGREGDRLILAYEVMRAEHPGTEFPGSGTAEFVVVARLGPVRASALADRLRDTIRQNVPGMSDIRVTGSVGVAVRDAPVDDRVWLSRADAAMYAAKRLGGDATHLG
jgi:hypothetical protein